MKQKHVAWTAAEDETITKAMRGATVWKEVAAALGRSYGAVRTRGYLLRLKMNDEARSRPL